MVTIHYLTFLPMDVSLHIAWILGPYLLIMGIWLLIMPDKALKLMATFKKTGNSEMLIYYGAFISLIFGPIMIQWLTRLNITENIKKEESFKLYQLHRVKQDTPTMGGIFILLAIFFSTLLWADIFNRYIIIRVFKIADLKWDGFCIFQIIFIKIFPINICWFK